MPNLKLWQTRLFFLILFLIPSNLAKHFLIPSSYVSGILVDYLIPTLYLTDIFIILLLILWLVEKLSENQQIGIWRYDRNLISPSVKLLLLFLVLLSPSITFAFSFIPAFYKYLKFLELSLFVFWIKQNISLKTLFSNIINVLTTSVLFQSLLALAQWLKQSSIFGYSFLGEQPYTLSTPSIDKITWFDGSLKIPPMGTFPHPNILAGFIISIFPLILFSLLKSQPSSKIRWFYFATLITSTITLFLTFSLSSWLALLLIGLPLTFIFYKQPSHIYQRTQQLSLIKNLPRFKSWQKIINQQAGNPVHDRKLRFPSVRFILIYTGLLLIFLSFSTKFSFLAPQSSFSRRSQLATISLNIIKDNPLTGIGLNNFTTVMEKYGFITATTRFFQPVHNIYLLILSETGIIGFIGFLILFLYPIYLNLKKPRSLFFIPFLSLLFIGLFDHYILTIQQGILLFFLFLILSTFSPKPQSPTNTNLS